MNLRETAIDRECNIGTYFPSDIDVLFGKGTPIITHPGNVAFRRELEAHQELYDREKDGRKMHIAHKIVHQFLKQGSRFLKENQLTGLWENVELKLAYKKAQQGLREGAPKRRSQKQSHPHKTKKNGKAAKPTSPRRVSNPSTIDKRSTMVTPESTPSPPPAVPLLGAESCDDDISVLTFVDKCDSLEELFSEGYSIE